MEGLELRLGERIDDSAFEHGCFYRATLLGLPLLLPLEEAAAGEYTGRFVAGGTLERSWLPAGLDHLSLNLFSPSRLGCSGQADSGFGTRNHYHVCVTDFAASSLALQLVTKPYDAPEVEGRFPGAGHLTHLFSYFGRPRFSISDGRHHMRFNADGTLVESLEGGAAMQLDYAATVRNLAALFVGGERASPLVRK